MKVNLVNDGPVTMQLDSSKSVSPALFISITIICPFYFRIARLVSFSEFGFNSKSLSN